MASNDDGRLKFVPYMDTKTLQQNTNTAVNIFKQLGDAAKQQGGNIDEAFKAGTGSLKTMAVTADNVFKRLEKAGADLSTTEGKISALEGVINKNKAALQKNIEAYAQYGTAAKEAFAQGDMKRFNDLTESMDGVRQNIRLLTEDTNNCVAVLKAMKGESEDSADGTEEFGDALGKSNKNLDKMLRSTKDLTTVTGMLPRGIQGAVTALIRLTTAAKSFIATPVGAVITALVLALKSLKTWFNNTTEGQNKMAQASGALQGVLSVLNKYVMKLGEGLAKLFSDHKSVKDFGELIKTYLLDRLEAFFKAFKALNQVFQDEEGNWGFYPEKLKEAGNYFVKALTGVSKETISDVTNELIEAGKKGSQIGLDEKNLERRRTEWTKQEAQIDAQITKLSALGNKESEIAALEAKKNAQQLVFAREDLRIAKEKAALKGPDDVSMSQEIAEKEAAVIQLEGQMTASNLRIKKAQDEQLLKQEAYITEWEAMQADFQNRRLEAEEDSLYQQQLIIEANYKKTLADIDKEQVALLKKKREAFGANAVLSEDELKYFENLREVAATERDKSTREINLQIEEETREARNLFADELTKEIDDIDKYYEEKLRLAQDNEELIAQLIINHEKEIALAQNAYSKKMLQSDLELAKTRIENAQNYYKSEIEREEALLRVKLEYKEKELELLEQEYAQNPSEELARDIALVTEEVKKLNNELERMPKQKMAELSSTFGQIFGSLSGLSGELGEVFGSLSSSFDSISKTMESDMSTMEGKASAISTIISGTVTLINMVVSASKARKQAEKEYYTNAIAFAHEYTLALNDTLRRQSDGNKFITDYAGKINDSFAAMSDAMTHYNEALAKLSEGKVKTSLYSAIDWANAGKSAAVGASIGVAGAALAGAAVGSILPGIGTAIGAAVGAIGGLLVGILGGKKKKNTFGGLTEVFPELVDATGSLNRELAEAMINTDQLDDKTKQLLQNALDWDDAVKEAKEQIAEITTELAGDVGNNLRNAIVDAWKAGEDASQRMFEVAGDSLENFVTQLLYSTIFSDVFDEFSDRLTDSLAPDGDNDILDDYEWLMDQMQAKDDLYVSLLDAVKQRAQEMGFGSFGELDSSASRSASKKGIAQASQDSVNELNGRMTAVQGHTYMIAANSNLIVANTNALLKSVIHIEAEANGLNARMERMENNLKTVKETVEDIALKGLKIK